MLVEAERTYKEYNMKLIEDIIVFVEQKYDYLDPVIYCVSYIFVTLKIIVFFFIDAQS